MDFVLDGLSWMCSHHQICIMTPGIIRAVGHHGLFWQWRCRVVTKSPVMQYQLAVDLELHPAVLALWQWLSFQR